MLLLLLLSRFSRVWLCATPEMAAHQAPPSLGFSRQEHWSGLPFPSSSMLHSDTQKREGETDFPYRRNDRIRKWLVCNLWCNCQLRQWMQKMQGDSIFTWTQSTTARGLTNYKGGKCRHMGEHFTNWWITNWMAILSSMLYASQWDTKRDTQSHICNIFPKMFPLK